MEQNHSHWWHVREMQLSVTSSTVNLLLDLHLVWSCSFIQLLQAYLPIPTVATNSRCTLGCKYSRHLRCLQPLIKFPALGNERCYVSSKAAALTQHTVQRERPCFFTFFKGQQGNAPETPSSNTSSLTKVQELCLGSCLITRATRTRVCSTTTNSEYECLLLAALVFSFARKSVTLCWWDLQCMEEQLLVQLITNNVAT